MNKKMCLLCDKNMCISETLLAMEIQLGNKADSNHRITKISTMCMLKNSITVYAH